MFEQIGFPIDKNHTVVPNGFQCHSLRLDASVFVALSQLRCSNVIWVDSPAGWGILRNGGSEPFHLDLFFVKSGRMEWATASGSGTVSGGQCMLVPSWIDRKLFSSEPGSHIYIRLETPSGHPDITGIQVRHSEYVEDSVFCMKRLLVNHDGWLLEHDFREHLGEVLSILIRRELFGVNTRPISWHAERLVQLIRETPPKQLSTRQIVRQFGMSLSSCRKFCLKNFGKPLGKVMEEILMSRAQALLTYSDLPIEVIAEELGYSDRFSFSKAFLRINHVTPGAFRKRLQ